MNESTGRRPLASISFRRLLTGLALAGQLLLVGCFGGVKVRPADPVDLLATIPLVSSDNVGELTSVTRRMLREQKLEELVATDPELVLRALDRLQRDAGDRPGLAAIAEIALNEAWRRELDNPLAAGGWYLLAADRAWSYLFADPISAEEAFNPRFRFVQRIYNEAVSGYVIGLATWHGGVRPHQRAVLDEVFDIRVGHRDTLWDPGYFDELLPAESIVIEGLSTRHRSPGLGAALVALRENRRLDSIEKYYPPEGIIYPASAVLRFDVDPFDADFDAPPGRRAAVLELYNPWETIEIEVADEHVPLAADLTAPYALLMDRADLGRLAITGMLRAEKALGREGLFLHEPYDPDKIPVLMVHGLRSSPQAWMELTNEIQGDPELRLAYQIWHYSYPTTLPYLYSGFRLRRELHRLRARLDPEDVDPASRSMVVVAHSMGGLLAKSLVTRSERRIWDTVMSIPPQELAGRPDYVDAMRSMFLFEPEPYIDRVVFISTPHRGAAMADTLPGKLSSALVRLPQEFRDMIDHLTAHNEAAIRPEMRPMLLHGSPTSIRALSPSHPLLQALAGIRIDDRVAVHTILGDRGLSTDDPEQISDGFVTYESAHLDEAVSELLVPSRHNAYSDPLAIREVLRILRLHLEELAAETSQP